MIHCPECGTANVDEAEFCTNCRTKLRKSQKKTPGTEGKQMLTVNKALEASERSSAANGGSKSSFITICAIGASLLCFVAGIWMLTITSEASAAGETGTIIEPAIHATGVYFIGKGFFLGPALYMMNKKS